MCKKEACVGDLIPNKLVDQIAQDFAKKTRPFLLALANEIAVQTPVVEKEEEEEGEHAEQNSSQDLNDSIVSLPSPPPPRSNQKFLFVFCFVFFSDRFF